MNSRDSRRYELPANLDCKTRNILYPPGEDNPECFWDTPRPKLLVVLDLLQRKQI